MEELKSIKSGSEQFLLKESRNSINRDDKSIYLNHIILF